MQTNDIFTKLQRVAPINDIERAIKADLIRHNPDPELDDLLSHIECTYKCDITNTNMHKDLIYQDGIDFLTKYNLMP